MILKKFFTACNGLDNAKNSLLNGKYLNHQVLKI